MSSIPLLKTLATDSLIYGISGIVSRFVNVFLVPIYTRVFAPAEFGLIALVINLFALLNILVILGLDNSVARWYYDSEDEEDRKRSINTFLWSCFAIACGFALLVVASRNFISERIFGEPAVAPALLIAAFNLPLTVFQAFTWNLLRMQRRAKMTAIFSLTISLLTIGLSVLFVVGFRAGIVGIFYAQLAASFVVVIWTLVLFRGQISALHVDWQRWKDMFFFSMPLVPGSIAFWVVNLSGAYFIQLMNSTHEAGLYQLGATIASGAAMVTGAFTMAWGPFAYSIHKQENAREVYAQTLQAYLALTSLLALFIMIFSREILLIFADEGYLDAYFVAGILSFNAILVGLGYIASIGTGLAKNNKAFGISMIGSAILLVGLNLFAVPHYGKEGAAFSILISQSIVPIAVFWHAQRLYPIPYKFWKATLIYIVCLGAGIAGVLFSANFMNSMLTNIVFKLSLLTLCSTFVFILVRREFRSSITSWTEPVIISPKG